MNEISTNTRRVLHLCDGDDVTIDGVSYLRLDGDFGPEWKVSPHGSNEPDRGCYWIDASEVATEWRAS